jgi:hypothetical protein
VLKRQKGRKRRRRVVVESEDESSDASSDDDIPLAKLARSGHSSDLKARSSRVVSSRTKKTTRSRKTAAKLLDTKVRPACSSSVGSSVGSAPSQNVAWPSSESARCRRAEVLFRSFARKFGLAKKWTLKFDNAKTRVGMTNYSTCVISLSRHYIRHARCTQAEIRETLLHEIAHALCPSHGN